LSRRNFVGRDFASLNFLLMNIGTVLTIFDNPDNYRDDLSRRNFVGRDFASLNFLLMNIGTVLTIFDNPDNNRDDLLSPDNYRDSSDDL
jgi:putative heme iron utilization protein